MSARIRFAWARCPACGEYEPLTGRTADSLRFVAHPDTGPECKGSNADARVAAADHVRDDLAQMREERDAATGARAEQLDQLIVGAQSQLDAIEASLAKDGAR